MSEQFDYTTTGKLKGKLDATSIQYDLRESLQKNARVGQCGLTQISELFTRYMPDYISTES